MAPKFAGLYAILGLDARSKPSPNEIKKAFHAIALRLHPDKNPYDSRATARFQNAVKAYETLLSTCVNIEEEPDPKVTRFQEPEEGEEEEDDVPQAMPKRIRKAFKKKANKKANEKHQVEAGVNNAQKRREEALETRELRDLQAQIDNYLKKVLEEPLGQEGRALSHHSDIHRRSLLLARKELNKQNRKQQKSTLNVKDPELEDVEVTKADAKEYATKLRAQEQKDEEFRLFELPLNYVHPFHEETEEEMRKNRRPSFFEREEEVNEKSKALADMLCEFWDDRVGEHGSACNGVNFEKAFKDLKKSRPARAAPKAAGDPEGDEFKAAAIALTRETLESIAKDEATIADYGSPRGPSQKPVASNDNRSLDDYVLSGSSWGRINKKSQNEKDEGEASEEDTEEVINSMRTGGPRKLVHEGSNIYRCRGCGTLHHVTEPNVVPKDSMARCCKVQFGKKRSSPGRREFRG
jgi:hypothetical protein